MEVYRGGFKDKKYIILKNQDAKLVWNWLLVIICLFAINEPFAGPLLH